MKKVTRILKAGEIVLITDEVYVGDPINRWLIGSLNIGKKLPADKVGLYRRPYIKKVNRKMTKAEPGCFW